MLRNNLRCPTFCCPPLVCSTWVELNSNIIILLSFLLSGRVCICVSVICWFIFFTGCADRLRSARQFACYVGQPSCFRTIVSWKSHRNPEFHLNSSQNTLARRCSDAAFSQQNSVEWKFQPAEIRNSSEVQVSYLQTSLCNKCNNTQSLHAVTVPHARRSACIWH